MGSTTSTGQRLGTPVANATTEEKAQRKASSAKPGEKGAPQAKKEKKPKAERTEFVPAGNCPQLKDGKFTAVPDGFDPKVHKPLKRNRFISEDVFFDIRAAHYESLATQLRAKAVEMKKLGGVKEKGVAKKLLKHMQGLADMRAQLKEKSGMSDADIDQMIQAFAKDAAPAPVVATS